jgi:cell division septation protein DedD
MTTSHVRTPAGRSRLALVALATALTLGAMGATATPLVAQDPDSTVARVQRLVNGGNRVGGRLLADSLLRLAPEGTPAYAEALYARALASSSAVEAERDYLRVSVEYSLTARAEDATMMVAQLKLARSDRLGARRNFERLVREHPTGTQVAKAAFWAGRLALEDGDAERGCPALGRARAAVSEEDVELANQISYYAQQCSPSALASPMPTAETPAPPVTRRGATPPPPTNPRPTSPPVARPRVVPPPDAPPPVSRDSVVTTDSVVSPPADVPPSPIEPPAPVVPEKEWSVQVAAFPKLRDASALSDVLQQRGFTARVWGDKPPFRVRVGRYPTREEADAAVARMKGARINGVVVEAEKP